MTAPTRLCGLETEYGISLDPAPGQRPDPDAEHPMRLSNAVVRAWAHESAAELGWDYRHEAPLRDSRGFTLARERADASLLTDVDEGLANTVLTNGARFYVDHAHPEYSGPEVTTARDAAVFDAAGDHIAARAAILASQALGRRVRLWKNNTDGKGASYGTHENYLLDRATPFHRVVVQFTPFLVTRGLLVGAGRVGLGTHGAHAGFQVTQRADFFEAEVGLETTLNRPIINTRDEPHADATRHRRLHVITGDATVGTWSTWLKVGTAALVLRALEENALPDPLGVTPRDPVAALRAFSHDPTARVAVAMLDGGRRRAVDVQEALLAACRELHERRPELWSPAQRTDNARVLDAWQEVLDALRADPMRLADRLDWVAKWRLLERYRERDGLAWDDPRLAAVDLQWADVDPERGLAVRLLASGRLRSVVEAEEVAAAVARPPGDTRAWFRGRCVERFGTRVAAASWDSVVVDSPRRGGLHRIPTPDPFRGTRALTEELLAASEDVDDLLDGLQAGAGPTGVS